MNKQYLQIVVAVVLLTGWTQASETQTELAPEIRLVAPWELAGPLVMVWPERLSGGRRMIPDTLELIQHLPEDIDVALAGERPPRIDWVPEIGRDTRYLPITTARTRDVGVWAGLPAATAEGRLINVRFDIPTQSIDRRERSNLRDNHEAARQLGRLLYGESRDEIPLRINPLQLTHNGRGIALLSNRVISENEGLSLTEIRNRLKSQVGLHTILFVPVPASEPRGFIDGYLRFVGTDTLLISEPIPHDSDSREQHRDLLNLLEQELDSDIQWIRIPRPSGAPQPGASYLHLIQAGNTLITPQFQSPEDQPTLSLLRRALPEAEVVPVRAEWLADLTPDLRLNRIAIWQ